MAQRLNCVDCEAFDVLFSLNPSSSFLNDSTRERVVIVFILMVFSIGLV